MFRGAGAKFAGFCGQHKHLNNTTVVVNKTTKSEDSYGAGMMSLSF